MTRDGAVFCWSVTVTWCKPRQGNSHHGGAGMWDTLLVKTSATQGSRDVLTRCKIRETGNTPEDLQEV